MINIVSFLQSRTRPSRSSRVLRTLIAPDRWLLVAVCVLSLFGILMVYDASVAIAIRDFGNQYYFVREQAKWLMLGFATCMLFSRVDYHVWQRLAIPLLIATVGLLVAVFIPGIGIHALGARRWVNFGVFVLQPAELAKLVLVILFSTWFTVKQPRSVLIVLSVLFIIGLVVAEPDLGTSLILLGVAIILYFYSGAPLWQFLLLLPVVFGSILGLAVLSPYRLRRITTFLNPETDPLGASYQIRQILLALGSGGLFGVGIGKSRQKYEYLPEASTDSIFAIIGEEIGFVGSVVVVILFLLIIWRAFRIAKRSPDAFGRMLSAGIGSWFAVQTLLNLASMVALVPLTGIPLPFVSYGGSSLIILLSAVGILANVSRQSSRGI